MILNWEQNRCISCAHQDRGHYLGMVFAGGASVIVFALQDTSDPRRGPVPDGGGRRHHTQHQDLRQAPGRRG